MAEIGVIGGSGLYEIPGLKILEEREQKTPYGMPSAPYMIGRLGEVEAVFLPRHGLKHSLPPHKINYRANLWGMRELGVRRIIAVNAAGGITAHCTPGALVAVDQVLDMTQGAREGTFADGPEVAHIDFTEPCCPEVRAALIASAEALKEKIIQSGTYVCVNGPRLESRAEIKLFAAWGADVVGMTMMPEAALARELEICYASLAVVTNFAAGLTGEKLTTDEVVQTMGQALARLRAVLSEVMPRLTKERGCPCKDALQGTRL